MPAQPTADRNQTEAETGAALIAALAKVRARPAAEIAESWAEDGDVEIVSVEAEAVVIFVEDALGVENICEVADLDEAQRTSLVSLGTLVQQRLGAMVGATR